MAIATAAPASEQHRPSRRWPWSAAVLVVVLALGLLAHWMTDDHALTSGGHGLGGTVTVGHTEYFDALVYPAGVRTTSARINLHSLTLKVVLNSANAVVTVGVCTLRRPGDLLATHDLSADCSSFAPLRAGWLTVSHEAEVLVAVTPREPGVVHFDGVDVSYRQGLRWGHQHIDTDIVVTAR